MAAAIYWPYQATLQVAIEMLRRNPPSIGAFGLIMDIASLPKGSGELAAAQATVREMSVTPDEFSLWYQQYQSWMQENFAHLVGRLFDQHH